MKPDLDACRQAFRTCAEAKSLFSDNAAAAKSVEKNLGSAKKQVSSALGKKIRAKAVIETSNQKEKGNPL